MTTAALDRIDLPDAPDLPGLNFRLFRGPSDYPHMARALNAAVAADQVERVVTADDIAGNYEHLVNSDPARDMLFVELDGQVAGYSRVWWQQEVDGPRLYAHLMYLAPEARGRGIEPAVLGHLERRLREIAADHAAAAGPAAVGERLLQTDAAETQSAYTALLLARGYTAVRHSFSMVRPLDEPIVPTPLPAGIEVRAAQPKHYRSIWEADQEAFRDHWGYVEPTEEFYRGWLSNPEFMPHLWQIGWDAAAGAVAGMVLNFFNAAENEKFGRLRGYTEGISVRRPWRRRGLSRALLTRSLQMFKDMGMTEAALGVDTQNPNGALRLYESVGFRVKQRGSLYRKPLD